MQNIIHKGTTRRALTLLAVFLVGGISLLSVVNASIAADAPNPDWWDEAIFYEIFVRSFNDSDCDGIGDFNGITEKLDYLQELGVTALWLMPIHPSPSYHGYDVIDYFAVNPDYGTLDDLERLLEEAHKRGFRVIIDLVLNHTSSEHPWFVDANSKADSAFRDWYLWSNDEQGNGWHQGEQGYYYGYFWSGMPDLNYHNPEVTTQMEDVVLFWLDEIGIDGFRVDAAKHLIEEGDQLENTPATHAWYRIFYANYKAQHPHVYTVGEVFGAGGFIVSTYEQEFDHLFNFELSSGFVNSANGGSNTGINSAYTFTLRDMPWGGYATFLTNHDQNRVMSVLYGDLGKAKVAASLMLTAPGTPFIYYGEEIGMRGQKPDEDIRLPMQWSDGANAGFACSQTEPWRAPYQDFERVNVAVQQADEDSLWSHYHQMIALRKAYPALRIGETTLVDTDQRALFAALHTTPNEQLLVLVNLGDQVLEGFVLSSEASPIPVGENQLQSVVGDVDLFLSVQDEGAFAIEVDALIQPYQTVILKLEN